MTRSAFDILSDAGFKPDGRFTYQVAKVNTDLAYRLAMPLPGWAIVTFADTDGNVTEEEFNGSYALRSATGRISRLKRGEETL